MGTHTPGPWTYSGGGIWAKSPWNATVRIAELRMGVISKMNGIDQEANTSVILAAPLLLDALYQVLAVANLRDHPAISEMARAAIAAAKVSP